MASFPTFDLDQSNIYVRWGQEFISDGFNRKTLSFPKGVYHGFIPSPDSSDPSNVLRLSPSLVEGYSLARTKTETGNRIVDIFIENDILLNFTGHTVFPIYVIAKTNYSTRKETTGQIFTRATAGNGVTEVTICRVEKPSNLAVFFTTVPDDRHEPTAYSTQDFGFMPDGSIDDLADTLNMTTEVNAARTDIDTGFVHPSLNERLTQDFNTVETRLARATDVIQGNIHTIPNGSSVSSFNVSGSFGSKSRDFNPLITIDPAGLPGTGGGGADGLLSSAPDNIAILIDPDSGKRFIDTDGTVVYGRIPSGSTFVTTGITSTFTNALLTVTGDGDYVAAGVLAGDLVLGPDGEYYEVSGPVSPTSFFLTRAFAGTTATLFEAPIRRFTVDFYTLKTGVETVYTFNTVADTDFQIYFEAFDQLANIRQDSTLTMLKSLTSDVIDASTSDPGIFLLAPDGGTVALTALQGNDDRILNVCKTDGSTPFTSLQSYTTPVTISAATDITHVGYINDTANLTESGFQGASSSVSGANSFTAVFPFTVKHYYATVSEFRDPGSFSGESVLVTGLSQPSSTSVKVDWVITGDTTFRMGIVAFGVL